MSDVFKSSDCEYVPVCAGDRSGLQISSGCYYSSVLTIIQNSHQKTKHLLLKLGTKGTYVLKGFVIQSDHSNQSEISVI